MKTIDVSLNMADCTPGFWDNYWDCPIGRSNKDPDIHCLILQEYHAKLWSRKLPNGQTMGLKKGVGSNYLTWHDFRFGSDSILASFRYKNNEKMIKDVMNSVPDYKEYISRYLRESYTIGGFVIFPKYHGGINQARGFNRYIRDRFDLTLDCIRKYYIGETSPLFSVLVKNKVFFDLFVDFRGYVDYFFLQDLVSSDYSEIKFFLKNNDDSEVLPKTIEEYFAFIEAQLQFVSKRNQRIKEFISNNTI